MYNIHVYIYTCTFILLSPVGCYINSCDALWLEVVAIALFCLVLISPVMLIGYINKNETLFN